QSFQFENSNEVLLKFDFSGLDLKRDYNFVVKTPEGSIVDQRIFQTLALKTAFSKIALISCMSDVQEGQDEIWQQLQSSNPEALFFLGDNSYLQLGIEGFIKKLTPRKIWDRHMETRQRLHVFHWSRLRPIFAIWDDNDYSEKDSDGTSALKPASAKIFRQFFPLLKQDASFHQGPGIAFALHWKKNHFYFLDNRSFRTRSGVRSESHFGEEQTQWLISHMKKQKGVQWLIGGGQFFGGYHRFESFQKNHPNDFKKFLQKLKALNKNVIFVSGDRHMSEVMKIPKDIFGRKSFEITSSPIHSKVYPGAIKKFPNPYQISGVDGVWNYVLLTPQVREKQKQFEVQSVGRQGQVYFETVIGFDDDRD
ncbi:MAG: alkaline phosphatase D family protein, partial [Pseudomonadota bacterium]